MQLLVSVLVGSTHNHGSTNRTQFAAGCVLLQEFPPLREDGQVLQRNEGKWDFNLDESEDR